MFISPGDIAFVILVKDSLQEYFSLRTGSLVLV